MVFKYLLRFDDIAPNMNWRLFYKIKDLLIKYKIKPILGVIPNNKDKELKKFPVCKSNFFSEIKKLKSLGWTIAMHGYEHVYFENKIKDYLSMRVKSEFVGESFEVQNLKIEKGISILKKNNLNTDIFFAPNHSFDITTIDCLKMNNFNYIIDGYGFAPFTDRGMSFIPQMFNRPRKYPFGLHTFVFHVNEFNDEHYREFERFIDDNHKFIIDFNKALNFRNSPTLEFLSLIIKYLLIFKRKIQNFFKIDY